jgi:nucleolar protein 15
MSKRLVSAAKIEQRLAAVEGNEWDSESSGEEATEEDDLMTLPETKPLGSRRKQSKIESSTSNGLSSVVYVGHIPHGFYEEQMRGFFSQFGDVSF